MKERCVKKRRKMSESSKTPDDPEIGAPQKKRQLTPQECRDEQLLLNSLGLVAHFEILDYNFTAKRLISQKVLYILTALDRLIDVLAGPCPTVFSEIVNACSLDEWEQKKDVFARLVVSRRKEISYELHALYKESVRIANMQKTSTPDVLNSEKWRPVLVALLCCRIGASFKFIDLEVRSVVEPAHTTLCSILTLGTKHFSKTVDQSRAADVRDEFSAVGDAVDSDESDAHCPVCTNAYAAERTRAVMKCCQSKNSICSPCLRHHAFSNSNAGYNQVFSCPFCRAEIDLYSTAEMPSEPSSNDKKRRRHEAPAD